MECDAGGGLWRHCPAPAGRLCRFGARYLDPRFYPPFNSIHNISPCLRIYAAIHTQMIPYHWKIMSAATSLSHQHLKTGCHERVRRSLPVPIPGSIVVTRRKTTRVPFAGVAVYSARSQPLAAWTQGFDLANLTADLDRACLVLETGVNQRWRYAAFRRTPENVEEAGAWETAKKNCR